MSENILGLTLAVITQPLLVNVPVLELENGLPGFDEVAADLLAHVKIAALPLPYGSIFVRITQNDASIGLSL